MKKAPSTILAAAGITVGLLGFALPASAAPAPAGPHHSNSGPNWKPSGNNKNDKGSKNKKQPSRNCQPPRDTKGGKPWDTKGGKQHKGHGQPPALVESPNQKTKTNGRTGPVKSWQNPPHTIACRPAPAPPRGKNKKSSKGHTATWTNPRNNKGHGNRP
jgi:hypothetical protein